MGTTEQGALQRDDLPAELLDDEEDREELRRRYYGLLPELRVVLPGVQGLVAFLLTAPFAARFGGLEALGRATFGVAMTSSLVATVRLLNPTALHRVAPSTERSRLPPRSRGLRIGGTG